MLLQTKKKSTSQETRLFVPGTAVAGVPKPAATMRQLMEKTLSELKWSGQLKASVMKTTQGNSSESREFVILKVGKQKLKNIKSDLFCLSFRTFIIWLFTNFA